MKNHLKSFKELHVNEAIEVGKKKLTGNFTIDINNFESLSREVGYYNCKANRKDDNDEYNINDIKEYERLRGEQLDMMQNMIELYSTIMKYLNKK